MGLRTIATTGVVGAMDTAACLAATPAAATITSGLGAGLDWGQRGGAGRRRSGWPVTVRSWSASPSTVRAGSPTTAITGLNGDTRLVGIDHRVHRG